MVCREPTVNRGLAGSSIAAAVAELWRLLLRKDEKASCSCVLSLSKCCF